jgi:hypothetical protein
MPKRYQNKAETVAEFPLDYAARWDTTTAAGMTFTTDEATGDLSAWVDATGNYTLDSVRTNEPIWTPGALAFTAATGMQEVTTDFDASDMTLLCVASYDGVSAYDYMVVAPNETSIGNQGGTDEKIAFVMDATGSTIYKSTNDLTDEVMVLGIENDHVGTNDNDKTPYVGKTALTTHATVTDANSSAGYINLGWYLDDTRCVEGTFYELIIWDRLLTTAEREAAVDYLSAKWQAGNNDAVTPSITSSTARTWTTPEPDPQAKKLPSYSSFAHRVEAQRNTHAPRRKSSGGINAGDYPSLIPNLQMWFRSDHTGGMTFDSGDAKSGGVVSAWTDITGNVTLNTATSGDTAVDYRVNSVKGGFPSLEGGTSVAPKSIEATTTLNVDNSTGQERLYWMAFTIGDASKNSSPGGPHGNIVFGGTQAAFATDQMPKPLVSYVGSVTAGTNYLVADAGKPADDGRIHVMAWRIIDLGTTAEIESWYCGLRLPNRTSSSADGDPRAAVGALSTSNFDAEGAQFLEMGVAASTTATEQVYTDGQVESLLRYLCDRYDVDYMPENAPITIGVWDRQTSSLSQGDLCLWFDPSTIGAQDWELHPDVAALHTTPANFTLETGAAANAVPMTIKTDATIKAQVIESDETVTTDQHQESANVYTSTETTDFPADTDGMSHYLVCYIDSATTTGSGARCGSAITQLRNLSTTTIQNYGGSTALNWATSTDKWIIIGNSYAYDDDGTGTEGYPGATDTDPACYFYLNDDTMKTLDTSTSGSFSVEVWNNWDIADGVCKVVEHFVYKHPLTIDEINELRKYVLYKYADHKFGFTHLSAHHVDRATVAHWDFDGDALDRTGNKAAFNTGTYVAADLPNPSKAECHSHTAATGFSYTSLDSDLDTLDAFTWCAAIYLDSYPTASVWRPLVRSAPPAGGTGSVNNIRYSFRVEQTTGELRFVQQHGNKVTDNYNSTVQVPLQEWCYVGISRAADGTTARLIVNDTVEEITGLTKPDNGGNSRFEMLEEWDGDDFVGDIYSAIFKSTESSSGELLAMRNQVFNLKP